MYVIYSLTPTPEGDKTPDRRGDEKRVVETFDREQDAQLVLDALKKADTLGMNCYLLEYENIE